MALVAASRAQTWTISELSRLTGVNVERIRYYEKIKLLPPLPRTEGARRA